jgi:hypothetical protein
LLFVRQADRLVFGNCPARCILRAGDNNSLMVSPESAAADWNRFFCAADMRAS